MKVWFWILKISNDTDYSSVTQPTNANVFSHYYSSGVDRIRVMVSCEDDVPGKQKDNHGPIIKWKYPVPSCTPFVSILRGQAMQVFWKHRNHKTLSHNCVFFWCCFLPSQISSTFLQWFSTFYHKKGTKTGATSLCLEFFSQKNTNYHTTQPEIPNGHPSSASRRLQTYTNSLVGFC